MDSSIPLSITVFPYLHSGHYNLTSWDYSKREHLTYGGIPYHELPVAFIRAKYNNTFIDIHSYDGKRLHWAIIMSAMKENVNS